MVSLSVRGEFVSLLMLAAVFRDYKHLKLIRGDDRVVFEEDKTLMAEDCV
jgi:hypothetical protein